VITQTGNIHVVVFAEITLAFILFPVAGPLWFRIGIDDTATIEQTVLIVIFGDITIIGLCRQFTENDITVGIKTTPF